MAYIFVNGFCPRRFAQITKCPYWMGATIYIGYLVGEQTGHKLKQQSHSLSWDPRRYVFNEKMAH